MPHSATSKLAPASNGDPAQMRDPFSPFEIDVESMEMEFAGKLWYWRGPSPYHFITVPEDVCVGLRAVSAVVSYGWGMMPVNVRIGNSAFGTSLFPKDGGYVVPIKDVVRNVEGLADGDTATVNLSIRS
jgi:Domain of unknown function (DUF1905)